MASEVSSVCFRFDEVLILAKRQHFLTTRVQTVPPFSIMKIGDLLLATRIFHCLLARKMEQFVYFYIHCESYG